jgi:hypothetical protein
VVVIGPFEKIGISAKALAVRSRALRPNLSEAVFILFDCD